MSLFQNEDLFFHFVIVQKGLNHKGSLNHYALRGKLTHKTSVFTTSVFSSKIYNLPGTWVSAEQLVCRPKQQKRKMIIRLEGRFYEAGAVRNQ